MHGKYTLGVDQAPSCIGSPPPSVVDPHAEALHNECPGNDLFPLVIVEGLVRERPRHTAQCRVIQARVEASSEGAEVSIGVGQLWLVAVVQVIKGPPDWSRQ